MFEDVTQIVPTIQGEGSNVGTPSLLIRFKKCTLKCPFCDTQWNNNRENKDLSFQTIRSYLNTYPNINNIMFTGGEPFLYIDEMAYILNYIHNNYSQIMYCEIETNGVLLNSNVLTHFYNKLNDNLINITLNISPKLGPECYKNDITNKEIKNFYIRNFMDIIAKQESFNFKYIIKIVYSKLWEKYIESFLISIKKLTEYKQFIEHVYIMPKTPDFRKYLSELDFIYDFRDSYNNTIKYCLKNGYKVSCREHVWIWYDNKDELIEVLNGN